MALKLITPSTGTCATLDELKSHLRLSTASTDEDVMLTMYLQAAERDAENRMRRSVSQQTWEFVLDSFPSGGIEIPRPPISSSAADVSITYIDSSGSTVVFDSTAYTVDSDTEPAWVVPSYENQWPETDDAVNAVRIRYLCGYSTANPVPSVIKIWVLMKAGSLYENREHLGDERTKELPRSFVDGLIDPYVVHFFPVTEDD